MEDIETIVKAIESLTLFGYLVLSIKWLIDDATKDREFLNDLRKEERQGRLDRENDIIEDWKRIRKIDN